MTKLVYSAQDWFLRICFCSSVRDAPDAPLAEVVNVGTSSDFDVIVNTTRAKTLSANEMRALLLHECYHAVESFIISRYPEPKLPTKSEMLRARAQELGIPIVDIKLADDNNTNELIGYLTR